MFSVKDFFSKCDQIRSLLGIWSHLLKKSLMENFIFCAVKIGICVLLTFRSHNRENLSFTQFSTRVVGWLLLTFFIIFTQSVKFYTSNTRIDPNFGGLFRGLFWGVCVCVCACVCVCWGGCLKLCLNLQIWHIRTDKYLVSENIPFSTKVLLILLMLAFFCNKLAFFGQNSTFTQSYSVRVAFEISVLQFSFQFS